MAGSDDKAFTFSTWNLYPLLSDYDRAWSFDGIAMVKFIEENCFFLFLGWFGQNNWFGQNKWPSLVGANVNYQQRIRATDLPLKINGWSVSASEFDITFAYEVRPEAAPESEPLFTAEIRWQGFDMNPFEVEESLLPGPDEFRTSSGTLI